MKIIKIDNGRKLNVSSITIGYLEENKIEQIKFEIPEEYKDFGKKACFKASGKTFAKTFDNITDDTLTLTRDITQFKELEMSIAFFKAENEDEIVARTSILKIYIENAVICDDDVKPDDPKIIILDDLITKVTNLDNTVTKNEEIRESQESTRQENEETRQNNESSRQEYIENLKDKVDKGDFNGATYLPSVDNQGNISWTNDKGLDNPTTQNIRGPQGVQGPQGEAFKIKKTYPSIEAMQADFDNMEVGDYVMITSSIEVEDNAKLYSKTETEWVFITDFSGATGIQGEQGPQGEQGIQGERGIGISKLEVKDGYLYVTLTDDTTQNAGLIITDEAKNYIIEQVTNNAESKFNIYYNGKVSDFDNNAETKTNGFNENANAKLKEYNDNATQKIAEYDEHSEELDGKIVSTRNELGRLKDNVLEVGEATDTFIRVEDSALAELQELSIEGVLKQNTTTGKNSLPTTDTINKKGVTFNGVTFKLNDDGSITTTGTATSSMNIYLNKDFISMEPGTYTLSDGVTTGESSTTYFLYTDIKHLDGTNWDEKNLATYAVNTSTIDEQFLYKPRIVIRNGITLNNVTFYPQLEIGSSATSYEPYTGGKPSPSPNYPQEIKTITDNLKITSCNKNLLRLKKQDDFTIDGLTYVFQDDGGLKITGTSTNTSRLFLELKNPIILNKGIYTFSIKSSGNTPSNSTRLLENSELSGDDTSFAGKYVSLKSNDTVKITSTLIDSKTYQYVYLYTNKNVTVDAILYFQLEQGSTATLYEQHLETQINANLGTEFIGKINKTYKDTLKVEYNQTEGQYHLILNKNIGKVVLDGSENWTLSANGFILGAGEVYKHFKRNLNAFNGICNYFLVNTTSVTWSKNNYCGWNTSGVFWIREDHILATTVEDFKTWLSTHNTEVYYVLGTPYEVDLGIVDMPLSYNEITNIFTDSDLLPTINAKYYRNFEKTVQDVAYEIEAGVELDGSYKDNTLSLSLLNDTGTQLSKIDVEIPQGQELHYTWDGTTGDDAKEIFQMVYGYYKAGKIINVDLNYKNKMYKLANISNPANKGNELYCQFMTLDYYTDSTDFVFMQSVNAVLTLNSGVVSEISINESIDKFRLIREYDGKNGALPTNNTKEYTPTGNYEPATKKYVDETHYKYINGYKTSGTQVLKNINGTLTWVSE